MNDAKQIITDMLKEHTGISFLDSGGAYGRNYERNAKRDFESEQACIVDIDSEFKEINISYNLYHFLLNNLDYDATCKRLEKRFQQYADKPENKDKSYFELVEEFAEKLHDSSYEGNKVITENTYNYDNLLNQDFQYTQFEYKKSAYIFLMIHGGCDIRGGYTEPRIFRVYDDADFITSQVDCYACCKNEHQFDSDDCGFHWYSDSKIELGDSLSNVTINNGKAYCPCGSELQFSVRDY
jgi:hypothetical protein